MLKLLNDLRALIDMANSNAAANPGDTPRWSLFLTNRSFIALAIAILLNAGELVGLDLRPYLKGFTPDIIADNAVEIATLALAAWAAVERLVGKTRVIWNRRQAVKAVEESLAPNSVNTDGVSERLTAGGLPVSLTGR